MSSNILSSEESRSKDTDNLCQFGPCASGSYHKDGAYSISSDLTAAQDSLGEALCKNLILFNGWEAVAVGLCGLHRG